MSVLVVIPTVKGRDKFLEQCCEAYHDTCPSAIIATYHYFSTCGNAWNHGAAYARKRGFTYVHMTADDLIPHPGWYEAAVETVEAGHLPCALIRSPGGEVQVHGAWGGLEQADWAHMEGASVPFCKTIDWIDIPPIHYYSDNAYDDAQKLVNGYTFVARTNYAFTHSSAEPGRKSMGEDEKKIWQDWRANLVEPSEYSHVPPEYLAAPGDTTDPFVSPMREVEFPQ